MKRLAKILALALAVMMACAAFGGCGGKKKDGGTGSAESGASSAESAASAGASSGAASAGGTQSTAGGGGGGGVKKITCWIGYGSYNFNAVGEIIKKFNAAQSKYVVSQTNNGGSDQLRTKLLSLEQKEYPSVISGTPVTIAQYAENDFTVPIQEFMGNDKWADDMFPSVRASYTDRKGRLVGVPIGVSVTGYGVNLDALKKTGYELKDVDSFEKMVEIAIKAVKGGHIRYGISFGVGNDTHDTLRVQGMDFIDNGNGWNSSARKALLQSGNNKAIIEKYCGLITKLYTEKAAREYSNFGVGVGEFSAGNILFYGCTNSYFSPIVVTGKTNFNWDFLPHPGLDSNAKYKGSILSEGTGLFICNTGDKEEEQGAYEFLKYCTSTEAQDIMCTMTTYVPYTKSAAASKAITDFHTNKFPQAKSVTDRLLNSSKDLRGTYAAVGSELQYGLIDMMQIISTEPTKDYKDDIANLNNRVQQALDNQARREALQKK